MLKFISVPLFNLVVLSSGKEKVGSRYKLKVHHTRGQEEKGSVKAGGEWRIQSPPSSIQHPVFTMRFLGTTGKKHWKIQNLAS